MFDLTSVLNLKNLFTLSLNRSTPSRSICSSTDNNQVCAQPELHVDWHCVVAGPLTF